jgi:hypothetical protein
MNNSRSLVILLVFLFTAMHSRLWGQNEKAAKHVSAVLVQMRAERNRTNALLASHKYSDLELFRRDAARVNHAMVTDFGDNFTYCPVYYYFDTNYAAISQGKFEGVLLNEHFSPAQNIVIDSASTDFLIAYYGKPVWQTHKRNFWDTTRSEHEGGAPNGYGLVICDYKLRQLGYVNRVDYDFFNFRSMYRKSPYKFVSKKFNLSYYPTAAELSRRLDSRPPKTNVKRKKKREPSLSDPMPGIN